jgi:hypothetical protein
VARASRIWLGQQDGGPTTFARLAFPPAGQVYAADEAYCAVKSGLADSVSSGFYLDEVKERPDGLLEISKARAAEISLVGVAANLRARILDITAAPGMHTRQPSLPPVASARRASYEAESEGGLQPPARREPARSTSLRTIHPAPTILEKKTDLTKISFFDFAALAAGDNETQRNLGQRANGMRS